MRRAIQGAATAVLLLMAGSVQAAPPEIERGFRQFLEREIWPEARANGVSRAVFDRALGAVHPNLDLPDLVLPGETAPVEEVNRQAEFSSPAGYFDEKRMAGTVTRGRALLRTHADLLRRIERQTGVPGPIVVAIWGRESGYGTAKIPHNAFEVLGTKAYLARRKAMFREELIAALRIVQDGDREVADMRSSWAGALGQPQFMPTKFRELARDGDGDGRRDIWNSVPDTLLSIAVYLQDAGWVAGRPWGFEARVPATVSCTIEGPDRMRPVADLAGAGITRISGKPFPAAEARQPGTLLMPAGRFGPAFVATPNFYTIKSYNNSDLYALFIGHLADRIAGAEGAFQTPWSAPKGLTRGEVSRLQQRLEAKGMDVGGTDGLAGFKTRRSLGAAEEAAGRPATCWPTRETVRIAG
ncbi:lytic murein transglycosylase [Aureimonas jatrophae]|uniref:Lytic murein transglycosylase n=1 Tax=Aureimonas jatrophae TaxID=1166073 RepID=A0A1H0N792_9HYPH|nr:lytic murein transglycosylase [Aureimonas jatrophae]MBB3951596.1 lytic murein transglycosylase [Aureimonas jatrophae]SDO88599.1 lytic murein transglycosylase [Aureimonas jatrophae]